MRLIVLAILASAAAGSAFGAVAQPPKTDSCVWMRDLRNHTIGDSHTLYFDVGGREVLRVTTDNNCLAAVTSSDPIVLRNQPPTGRICNKLDWDITVRGTRCIVSGMSKLTPAEVAALPRKVKP